MDIVNFALIAGCLIFLVLSLLVPLAAKLRLPLPVVIASTGLSVSLIAYLSGFELAGSAIDTYDLWFVQSLALDAQTLLLVFLPPLLFDMALQVTPRRLRDDIWVVMLMAVVAVVLATLSVGFVVSAASPISLVACLLLGAAISTTDPSAVVSTFKEIGAPRRLLTILEGESLLNDAAAIALFALMIELLKGQSAIGPANIAVAFTHSFVVGAITGAAMSWLASRIFPILSRSTMAEMTLTAALAHGSYLLAEQGLGASGVVAVVFAGMGTRHFGMLKMGPKSWTTVLAIWGQVGFWASALILLFAATMAPRMLLDLSLREAALVPVAFLAAFAARWAVLFGLLPLLRSLNLTTQISRKQKILIWWGGVRGAVTLVLALSLLDVGPLEESDRRVVAAVGAGFVFATLLINASTLALVTSLLGMNRLSREDLALRERVVAWTRSQVHSYVEALANERSVESSALARVQKAYAEDSGPATEAPDLGDIEFGERLRMGLAILCNQEAKLTRRSFEAGAVGPAVTRILANNTEALSDAARTEGRDGYEETMKVQLKFTHTFKLSSVIQRLFHVDRALRGLLEYRLTALLETETNVRALMRFSDTSLSPMIGEAAANNLAQLLSERLNLVRLAIDAIGLQFPDYTETMEQKLVLRAAARRERQQYDLLMDDGIVGPELYRTLLAALDVKWKELDRPPTLDLGLSSLELINDVPLFSQLSAQQKSVIASSLKARLVMPEETILAKGERGNAMYFIASGVVDVLDGDDSIRLSNGDFFGEVSLFRPTVRRTTDLVAVSVCRLLVLSRKDFQTLMKRDSHIEQTIRAAGEKQLGEGFASNARSTSVE